ncbi:MAG: DUF2442 domain-containing protein, partial [Isosphaeraceae bacterium]
MILRIVEAEVRGDSRMRVSFNDGTSKVVDLRELLDGPVFEPPREPAFFA